MLLDRYLILHLFPATSALQYVSNQKCAQSTKWLAIQFHCTQAKMQMLFNHYESEVHIQDNSEALSPLKENTPWFENTTEGRKPPCS